MPTYSVGEVIKYLRTKKGISQEQLCNGLCSIATISKVERGVQILSKYNFDAIMQRLGENAENYLQANASNLFSCLFVLIIYISTRKMG